MSRTIMPFARSCWVTSCLLFASSSPRVGTPWRSTALKANVLIALPHPGRLHGAHAAVAHAARGAHAAAEQALELTRGGRTALRQLLRDLAHAHELDEGGVHRLHAVRGTGLERGVDLVGLALADEVAHAGGRHE